MCGSGKEEADLLSPRSGRKNRETGGAIKVSTSKESCISSGSPKEIELLEEMRVISGNSWTYKDFREITNVGKF